MNEKVKAYLKQYGTLVYFASITLTMWIFMNANIVIEYNSIGLPETFTKKWWIVSGMLLFMEVFLSGIVAMAGHVYINDCDYVTRYYKENEK